jgi:hypothetical protein
LAGDAMQQSSRFRAEIPKELVDEWNLRPSNPFDQKPHPETRTARSVGMLQA